MRSYGDALSARGDYRRFFADDIRLEVVGTDQRVQGAPAAEKAIRFLHEVAFDARPESATRFVHWCNRVRLSHKCPAVRRV